MPDLLEAIEIETAPAPRTSVIWMHGLGADGHDFAPVVPELNLPATMPVRFVFPHAPMQPVTINGGAIMRAWYDIRDDHGVRREDPAGVRASQKRIETLIEHDKARGIAAARIVLAGFSQGGAIALHTGLRHSERLAGIIALSCFLPVADTVPAEASPANRDVPIFMAHGIHDGMIPVTRARRSRDRLLELGYRVTWHEYPVSHSVCPEEISDISKWLRGIIAMSSHPFTP